MDGASGTVEHETANGERFAPPPHPTGPDPPARSSYGDARDRVRPMSHLDRLVVPRISEFVHAQFRLRLRQSPVAIGLQTIAALVFGVGCGGFGVWGSLEGVPVSTGLLVSAVGWPLALMPWTRIAFFGALLRLGRSSVYTPYRLVGLSADRVMMVSELGETELRFSGFQRRFETRSAFVFATTDAPFATSIPKRVFVDAAEVERFRQSFFAVSEAAAPVVRALDDSSEDGALRYTPTVEETRAGYALIVANSGLRWVRWVLGLVLLAVVGGSILGLARGPTDPSEPDLRMTLVVFFVVFLAALLGIARRKQTATIRAQLRPVSVIVDDEGVRTRTELGSLDAAFTDIRGFAEDAAVFVVLLPRDLGLILPKRAIPAPILEHLRTKLAASAAGTTSEPQRSP